MRENANTVPKPCTEEKQEAQDEDGEEGGGGGGEEEEEEDIEELRYVGQEAILHTNRGP